MLTYTSAPAHAQLLQPTEFAPKTQLYDPPIDEFSVLQVKLEGADAEGLEDVGGAGAGADGSVAAFDDAAATGGDDEENAGDGR